MLTTLIVSGIVAFLSIATGVLFMFFLAARYMESETPRWAQAVAAVLALTIAVSFATLLVTGFIVLSHVVVGA